jgi:hypothetical protein
MLTLKLLSLTRKNATYGNEWRNPLAAVASGFPVQVVESHWSGHCCSLSSDHGGSKFPVG